MRTVRRVLPRQLKAGHSLSTEAAVEEKCAPKIEHYRKKRPNAFPSDVVNVSQKPNTRVIKFEWEAFEKPHEKVLNPLIEWLGAWRKNRLVRCICFHGKYGSFSSVESIDALYDLYQTVGDLSPVCPQPEAIPKKKVQSQQKQNNSRDNRQSRGPPILQPPEPSKSCGPTAAVALVHDSIITGGGLGLLPPRLSIATNNVIFVSPLDPVARNDLPRFIDGGIGYRLGQSGCYGRAAALAGIDVTGINLSRAGIVSYVHTYNTFHKILDDLIVPTALEEVETIFDILQSDFDVAAGMAEIILDNGFNDDRELYKEFAEKFFSSSDLDQSIHLLKKHAKNDPLAATALENISSRLVHARILATLLERCAELTFSDALHFERHLAKALYENTEQRPSELTEDDIPFLFDNIPPPA